MSKVDLAVLDDPIARLEAATGPDRELNAAVAAATMGGRVSEFPGFYWTASQAHRQAPFATSSMDAALALYKEVLPQWNLDISIENYPNGRKTMAHLYGPTYSDLNYKQYARSDNHDSGPRAVLIALCRALRQEARDV